MVASQVLSQPAVSKFPRAHFSQWSCPKAIRWPCGVCVTGIDNDSIQCTSCQKWLHRKCSGIKSSMFKVTKTFVSRGCMNPVTGTGCTSVDIGVNAALTQLIMQVTLCTPHTQTQQFYGSVEFVRDNQGEPVPEETFTHSTLIVVINHPYLLSPSTTIHGIL